MKGGKSKAETRRGDTKLQSREEMTWASEHTDSSNSENQKGLDISIAKSFSPKRKTLLGEEEIWVDDVYTLYNDIRHIPLPFRSESSNSENQKGLDMSAANCYSLFSSSYNESDGKLLSSNSADFNGSDMSTLKSCSPFEGLDLDRFMNNVLKKTVIKPIRYEKSSDAPELALEYFKTVKKGGDYEFVDSVLNIPTSDFGCHINFFARLKGKDSPPEFLFAELRAGSPREVVDCCIINPKPYSFGEIPPPRLVLTHCKHVNCDECKVWADLKGNGTGQICV